MFGVYIYKETENGTEKVFNMVTNDKKIVDSFITWTIEMSKRYSENHINVITEGKVIYHY